MGSYISAGVLRQLLANVPDNAEITVRMDSFDNAIHAVVIVAADWYEIADDIPVLVFELSKDSGDVRHIVNKVDVH